MATAFLSMGCNMLSTANTSAIIGRHVSKMLPNPDPSTELEYDVVKFHRAIYMELLHIRSGIWCAGTGKRVGGCAVSSTRALSSGSCTAIPNASQPDSRPVIIQDWVGELPAIIRKGSGHTILVGVIRRDGEAFYRRRQSDILILRALGHPLQAAQANRITPALGVPMQCHTGTCRHKSWSSPSTEGFKQNDIDSILFTMVLQLESASCECIFP